MPSFSTLPVVKLHINGVVRTAVSTSGPRRNHLVRGPRRAGLQDSRPGWLSGPPPENLRALNRVLGCLFLFFSLCQFRLQLPDPGLGRHPGFPFGQPAFPLYLLCASSASSSLTRASAAILASRSANLPSRSRSNVGISCPVSGSCQRSSPRSHRTKSPTTAV